jgi:biopolymer transport protein ExbD
MNVTPLVDVVLVLLIIFMVIVPMLDKTAHIELPGIFHVDEEPKGKTDPFTLSFTTDGRMYFEEEELNAGRSDLIEPGEARSRVFFLSRHGGGQEGVVRRPGPLLG